MFILVINTAKRCANHEISTKNGTRAHDAEGNLHFSDQSDREKAGFLEETATEFGLLSKDAVARKTDGIKLDRGVQSHYYNRN